MLVMKTKAKERVKDNWLIKVGLISTRGIATPPMEGMIVVGLPPPPALNSPVPIYTPGWRKTQ